MDTHSMVNTVKGNRLVVERNAASWCLQWRYVCQSLIIIATYRQKNVTYWIKTNNEQETVIQQLEKYHTIEIIPEAENQSINKSINQMMSHTNTTNSFWWLQRATSASMLMKSPLVSQQDPQYNAIPTASSFFTNFYNSNDQIHTDWERPA